MNCITKMYVICLGIIIINIIIINNFFSISMISYNNVIKTRKIEAKNMTNPKYYYWSESKQLWVIIKKINGTNKYLGYYKTEKAAKLAVELFKKYGWNSENNWRVKYEVKELLKKDEVDK